MTAAELLTVALAAIFCPALPGCRRDATEVARATPGDAMGASPGLRASAAPGPRDAGIDVDVDPPTGMTVLLDGEPIGHTSPLHRRDLAPGPHALQVRAMGYYGVALSVNLTAGQALPLPLTLRPRPPEPYLRPASRSPPVAGMEEAPPGGTMGAHGGVPTVSVTMISPPEPRMPLPPGATPVEVRLVAQPAAPSRADNEPSDGRSVHLRYSRGVLTVGRLTITYIVGAGRSVDFVVPQDGCLWYRERVQMKAGSLVHLGRGLLHLRRTTPAGVEQAVVLRRAG